jgi:hypothetical protein
MTRLRLPAIVLASLVAATANADLRTFDVDPQYQQEVFAALTDVLTPDPQRGLIMEAHGRVELLPSGQILVNASPSTLEQVEQVLRAISNRQTAATPSATLRYWAVLGSRTQSGNDRGAPPPPALDDVLTELRRLHGDLAFRVIGSASLITASGQFGEVTGSTLGVEQTAFVRDESLNAEISLELKLTAPPPMMGTVEVGNLSLRVTLEPGEFMVLGESHMQLGGLEGPVFYVVRWER